MATMDSTKRQGVGWKMWAIVVLAAIGGFVVGSSYAGCKDGGRNSRRMLGVEQGAEALAPEAPQCPACEAQTPDCPRCVECAACPACEKCAACPACEKCPALTCPACPPGLEKQPEPEGCETPREAFHGYKSPKFDNPAASPITAWLDLKQFECPARKFGTDKVIDHSYEYMYTKYLGPIRNKQLSLLEIGLGCGMRYGTGHSLENWIHYLPASNISMLEYNQQCAEEWRPRVEATGGRMFIGSQDDPALLARVVEEAKAFGGYDVIIEDGVHDPFMQVKSLEGLWPAVKPGGIYVVEDVFRNYEPNYDTNPNTFMRLLHDIIDHVQCQSSWRNGFKMYSADWAARCAGATGLRAEVLSVECQWEACLLVKRPVGVLHHD